MDKVSIVMPVYNTEPFLRRAIDSVENQTYPNVELIIVDDASPDHAKDVYEEAHKQYGNIKIIRHEENKGISETRNDGIRAATGEWVMFLDSDDILYPDAVASMLEQVNNTTQVVMASFNRNINGTITCEYQGKLKSGVYPVGSLAKMLFEMIPLNVLSCIGTKLYSTSFLIENDLLFRTEYQYNEDLAFMIDVLMETDSVGYVDKPVYEYIIRQAESIQTSYRTHLTANLYRTRKKLNILFSKCDCLPDQRENLEKMWFSVVRESLIQEYKYKKQVSETLADVFDNKEILSEILQYKPENTAETLLKKYIIANNDHSILRLMRNREIKIRIRKMIKHILRVK